MDKSCFKFQCQRSSYLFKVSSRNFILILGGGGGGGGGSSRWPRVDLIIIIIGNILGGGRGGRVELFGGKASPVPPPR